MNRGMIEQTGSPQEIFRNPATAFTARFLGYSNAFSGCVAAVDGGSVAVDFGQGRKLAARWRSPALPRLGDRCTVAFRADRVSFHLKGGPGGGNVFPGIVETVAFLGSHFDYTITVDDLQVQAEGPVDNPVARGDAVTVAIAREHCHAFRDEE
jgi:ABC-type Fe3+/spermidine/putrescine transport system ATPase subunit